VIDPHAAYRGVASPNPAATRAPFFSLPSNVLLYLLTPARAYALRRSSHVTATRRQPDIARRRPALLLLSPRHASESRPLIPTRVAVLDLASKLPVQSLASG
jgi:hypothetical protein